MATVTVTGLGSTVDVEVEDAASVADALKKAAVDLGAQGLTARFNGEVVNNPEEVVIPNGGGNIIVTPREVKLG